MEDKVSVIVPFKGDDGIRSENWHWCWRWWNKALSTMDFEICIGEDLSDPYNRSRARNRAYDKSSGDVLVIADADTVIDDRTILPAIRMVRNGIAPWVIPYQTYFNLSQEYSEYLKTEDKLTLPSEYDDNFSYEHKILSWAGILVITRKGYQSIGGYDERFCGWGWEDNAFRLKLDMEYGEHQRMEGNAYHLWHPIAEADKFGSAQTEANRLLYTREYQLKYNHRDERLPPPNQVLA